MSALNVRIVRLEPMRVASVHAFGPQPEEQAWEKLTAWAEPRGLMNLSRQRIFGFNNPSPSPGSPNYGYEFWITLPADVEPEGDVEVKQFLGGLYAVARCKVLGRPYETIPATWKQLVQWREDSPYHGGNHQWLEEHIDTEANLAGEWDLDLYLPIRE